MTLAELITTMGFRLGDRDDMAARIPLELDILQDTALESRQWYPWFLESEVAHASTAIGERRIPLPLDFCAEIEESNLYLSDTETSPVRELVKKDPDVALRLHPGQGRPLAYAISGEYFRLYPLPDNVYVLHMRYIVKDARISDATATPKWLKYASDVILAELGFVLASKHIKDNDLAQQFAAEAQVAWKRLYDRHISRAEVNQSRSLGGNT
jgi:hypothetical protein